VHWHLFIRAMTRSYLCRFHIRQASFVLCQFDVDPQWLRILMTSLCAMTHSYLTFSYLPWLTDMWRTMIEDIYVSPNHMCHTSFICALTSLCTMSHSYLTFTYVPWLIHIWGTMIEDVYVSPNHVCHTAFICALTFSYVPWLIHIWRFHMCDVYHRYYVSSTWTHNWLRNYKYLRCVCCLCIQVFCTCKFKHMFVFADAQYIHACILRCMCCVGCEYRLRIWIYIYICICTYMCTCVYMCMYTSMNMRIFI